MKIVVAFAFLCAHACLAQIDTIKRVSIPIANYQIHDFVLVNALDSCKTRQLNTKLFYEIEYNESFNDTLILSKSTTIRCRLLSSTDSSLIVEPIGDVTQTQIIYKDKHIIYIGRDFDYDKKTINFLVCIKKTMIKQIIYRSKFKIFLTNLGIFNFGVGSISLLLDGPSVAAQYKVGNPNVTKKFYNTVIGGGILYTLSSIPAFIFGKKKKYFISTKSWGTEKKYWKITSKLCKH
jgi:hypothetical protein